ncbi:MAG: efflux RND transporter periplasmic adaptor subunit [Deltaproteobacteria bacterium]|nr:efflux RND transporter periplasmic adaptor subunit [Deltaproteobacteria bacterium]
MTEVRRTSRGFGLPRLTRVLLLVVMVMFAACGPREDFKPPPPPKVTVQQPVRRPVVDYLEFTGNTQAVNTVQLRARVEGYLEKVLFQDGDRVKKGQLLFLIQQNTYEAKLRQAEAEVMAQKARLLHAETEFARFTRLVQQKAASQTDLDKWHFERDAARASVLAAEAKRDLAKLDLSYTSVTAPFDGRIDRRQKDPGNLVGTAGEETVLAYINQIDPIYVYFTINERDLLRLVGQRPKPPDSIKQIDWPVAFGLADERDFPHQGRMDFAAISVDPTTGTLLMRAVFPNRDFKILPGLFAKVRVPTAEARSALLVPQEAVSFDQQGTYLLVVNDKNVVERRQIVTGPTIDKFTVIEDGLKGGERVVVQGLLRAMPGRQVTPVQEPPPKAEDKKEKNLSKGAEGGKGRS